MSKPRMVIYIEDGILRDIIVDPEVDIDVLAIDEDSHSERQYSYSFWSKRGTGQAHGEFSVSSSFVDIQFHNANRYLEGDDDDE